MIQTAILALVLLALGFFLWRSFREAMASMQEFEVQPGEQPGYRIVPRVQVAAFDLVEPGGRVVASSASEDALRRLRGRLS